MNARARFGLLLRVLPLVLLLAAGSVRAELPSRVARLNHVEGSVSFSPAGDLEWTEAARNRPLTRGDRLWTDRGSRAELQAGSSALRLHGRTRLAIVALDGRSTQLSLTQGTLYVRVRSLPAGENFEVDTPNLAWRATWPGEFRIDVDPAEATTRVTIHSGTGVVYGEQGQSLPLGAGQQITFRARALDQLAARESPPLDGFDRWAQERNRREDQSIAARYVPREVVGYQELDPHGQWRRDPVHGAMWLPQGLPDDWAPYRQGHWDWIAPWGWTWIDDAPWGFAPFHYGRWTLADGRWAWVPGRLSLQPAYAPALVAFLGGDADTVTWFPLAPGEAWEPPSRTTPGSLAGVNGDASTARGVTLAHQRNVRALTSISAADFHHGRPAAAGWLRVGASLLANAKLVAPPAAPARPQARNWRTPVVAPAAVRQVTAEARRPQTPAPASPQGAAPSAAAAPQPHAPPANPGGDDAKALRKPTAVSSKPHPRSAQSRPAVAAKEPVRKAPTAVSERLADPGPARANTAAAARGRASRTLEAERPLAAKTEERRRDKIRLAQEARRAKEVQRAAQARQQEQLRREAAARREERLRRLAHARQVEQARRAAERDARALDEQRQRHEQQARREQRERERRQAAWEREQQATTERWRREHEEWRQRQRLRDWPELRLDPRPVPQARPPEVWQRGIPVLVPGRTS